MPLERAEWVNRAGMRPPDGDFARFGAATVGGSVDVAWFAFEREAAFLMRKLDMFARDGVAVWKRATREHLRDAASRYSNLALFAHWKGPDLLPGDPAGCGDRLELWDDMIDSDTLASLFPPNWAGTVFLAVCTSVRPAEVLRRRRPQSICVCSRDGVSAGLSMAKLDVARRLMAADSKLSLWKALLQGAETIDKLARRP